MMKLIINDVPPTNNKFIGRDKDYRSGIRRRA